MINKKSKILLTGHKGLVGSAILKYLIKKGYKNVTTINRKKLDLRIQNKVFKFLENNKFDGVINAAAKVGGIYANNTFRAEFIYENLAIQNNIIHGSFLSGVKNLIFLGSSCVYPRNCRQPIKESYLLNGELEKTNEPYALAKIAGIKMCESYNFQYKTNYKCLMPCNLYGPNDNYNLENSHFLPALISKIHSAKIRKKKYLNIWGTGKPKRELMFVDDLADACIYFLNKKTKETLINIGSGFEMKIVDYANYLIKYLDAKLKIRFDLSKPDGTPRKIISNSTAKKYGWKCRTSFEEGIKLTYKDFLKKNL